MSKTMKNKLSLEDQVCRHDQARELAELLGDDAPESLWVWCYAPKPRVTLNGNTLPPNINKKYPKESVYRAYNHAELHILAGENRKNITKLNLCSPDIIEKKLLEPHREWETKYPDAPMAWSLAQGLIISLKNKLIKPESLNYGDKNERQKIPL